MSSLSPKQTLAWTLIPLLSTFTLQRAFLQFVRIQHVHAGGYLVHHLFIGALLVIGASFVGAFGARNGWLTRFVLATLGVGSAMVLDEVTYLVATGASDADYRSAKSLWGAVILISIASLFLLLLCKVRTCAARGSASETEAGGKRSVTSPS